ncbi:MAG: HD domain-containing protein [Thermodesulfobacteriota bacterium]|nr:HD domain-containing protein [Thermodesulfobacteriota bacterium]
MPKLPGELNDEPFVSWYRCSKCGRCWIRILFKGYHAGSFSFYATHVEKGVIETFHIDLIDEIFLASGITFVGGYDFGDRTTVYKGGFPVDLWSGFRNKERLRKAKEFAVKAHGQQMYGDKPYVYHLEHVHEVMKRYRHDNPDVLVHMAGWLHDVLEDTATSKTELLRNFGEEIADIVYRVTDELGADRAERKRKTYHKIRGHIDATTVKLCDRIANVEASSDVPKKLKMYRNEYRGFRDAVCFHDHDFLLGDLWRRLDQLLGFDK